MNYDNNILFSDRKRNISAIEALLAAFAPYAAENTDTSMAARVCRYVLVPLFAGVSGGMAGYLSLLLDTHGRHQHNANTAFNHAVGFSSPRQHGKQPPLSNARYFYACNPLTTFSNGKQGREALRLLERVASLLTRLLFPAYTFSSVCVGLKNQHEKVDHIMAKIRKGYARPLFSHPLRSFSTLSDAVRFIDRLTESNTGNYRFNIQQSFERSGSRWTVCRIVSGGVQ